MIDLTGQRFGRLVVIEYAGATGYGAGWRVRCDCGNEKIVSSGNLRTNRIFSCGCRKREILRERHKNAGHILAEDRVKMPVRPVGRPSLPSATIERALELLREGKLSLRQISAKLETEGMKISLAKLSMLAKENGLVLTKNKPHNKVGE